MAEVWRNVKKITADSPVWQGHDQGKVGFHFINNISAMTGQEDAPPLTCLTMLEINLTENVDFYRMV